MDRRKNNPEKLSTANVGEHISTYFIFQCIQYRRSKMIKIKVVRQIFANA